MTPHPTLDTALPVAASPQDLIATLEARGDWDAAKVVRDLIQDQADADEANEMYLDHGSEVEDLEEANEELSDALREIIEFVEELDPTGEPGEAQFKAALDAARSASTL